MEFSITGLSGEETLAAGNGGRDSMGFSSLSRTLCKLGDILGPV
jgi:hypothetical protein